MRVLARIAAVVAAVALYLVFWRVLGIGVLFGALWLDVDVPGYHEPGARGWWGWSIVAAWWLGLVAVVWWVGFRLSWWRRPA